jgi:DNA helicase-2/ATP-dependent DNA helicase PcrA
MDFLSGLNPQQREAVEHVEGPLLILAGAGSGKTRVITHRIANLILRRGVYGPSILAVTFTNKAAGEMKDRVLKLLAGKSPDSGPIVSTFHSFCVRLLRRDGAPLAALRPGFTPDFQIYDDADQLALVKQIYKRLGLDEKFMQHRAALSRISHAKNHKKSAHDIQRMAADPKAEKLAVVFDHYEQSLQKANALDFDDLLLEAVRLLHHSQETRERWGRRLQFLMVDEYQDTNRSQYELLRLLAPLHDNVAVVGDEDQSIYGWRGADIRNILDFERDFPGAKVIRLEQNYRSTKNILDAAGAVVSNNKARKGKWLWTQSGEGAPVCLYEALDGEQEALFIADAVEKIFARETDTHVAILYRTNFQSRQIEEALRRYGRRYVVVGGLSFYQRAEVKDALAYLKVLLNPRDNISLLRIINVPARGIGATTVAQIEKLAAERGLTAWEAIASGLETHSFGSRAEAALKSFQTLIEGLRAAAQSGGARDTLQAVLERTGYREMLETDAAPDSESRLGNLDELLSAAADSDERGDTLAEFLDHAALVSDADMVDEKAAVSLLTMHNAKGLEFPVVFIAGMEEGLFPHSRSQESEAQLEEERRLCYVAMTRAEKRLYLTWARTRRRYGGSPPEPCEPSRFLREVPAHLTQDLGERLKPGHLDLFGEREMVREAVRKNTYTGKTYNSLDHIAQFFADRGIRPPAQAPAPEVRMEPEPVKSLPAPAAAKAARSEPGVRAGATVMHPKYGRGTVVRKDGDGEDAKLTISFPGYGLKKIVAKYAVLKAGN